MKQKIKESDLQRVVLQWLKVHDICAWRMPVGPVVHSLGKGSNVKQFWKASPIKGFPDIAGVLKRKYPGKFFTIELKSSTGKLRNEQREWMNTLHQAGAVVAVVRSIDELQATMERWGEVSSRD